MGKRFAIVIGVAAAAVLALGAQTATSSTVEPVDSTPPDLQLSGPKKQELGNAVKVKASCGDEACTVSADGKLTHVKVLALLQGANADLGPGETATLKLKLSKKIRKLAVKALDKGKNVQARVLASVPPNGDDVKRKITLVK